MPKRSVDEAEESRLLLRRILGKLPSMSARQNLYVDDARHEKVLTWLVQMTRDRDVLGLVITEYGALDSIQECLKAHVDPRVVSVALRLLAHWISMDADGAILSIIEQHYCDILDFLRLQHSNHDAVHAASLLGLCEISANPHWATRFMDDSDLIRDGILCFMDARETLAQVARRLIGVIVANASVSLANLRWHEDILLGASFRQLIQSVLDCSVADCGKLRRERFAVLDLFGALLEQLPRTQPLLIPKCFKWLKCADRLTQGKATDVVVLAIECKLQAVDDAELSQLLTSILENPLSRTEQRCAIMISRQIALTDPSRAVPVARTLISIMSQPRAKEVATLCLDFMAQLSSMQPPSIESVLPWLCDQNSGSFALYCGQISTLTSHLDVSEETLIRLLNASINALRGGDGSCRHIESALTIIQIIVRKLVVFCKDADPDGAFLQELILLTLDPQEEIRELAHRFLTAYYEIPSLESRPVCAEIKRAFGDGSIHVRAQALRAFRACAIRHDRVREEFTADVGKIVLDWMAVHDAFLRHAVFKFLLENLETGLASIVQWTLRLIRNVDFPVVFNREADAEVRRAVVLLCKHLLAFDDSTNHDQVALRAVLDAASHDTSRFVRHTAASSSASKEADAYFEQLTAGIREIVGDHVAGSDRNTVEDDIECEEGHIHMECE